MTLASRYGVGVTAPSRKRRIDEIGDESRRRIMDAAEALFAAKGYDRTSFVDIAERSGISRGSIPWHFQNKDGLLIAVVERAIDRFVPADSLTSFDPEGMREVLERVKQWLRHPTAAMVYMILTEALSTDSPVHEHYVEFFRERRKAVLLLLAASSGLTRASRAEFAALEPVADVVSGALVGLGLQYQLDPTLDLDAAIEALEALVEGAIGGGSAKRSRSRSTQRDSSARRTRQAATGS